LDQANKIIGGQIKEYGKIEMSKYSEELEKDFNAIKQSTKNLIKKGEKLAFEEYHGARSLEKLKQEMKRI